MSITINGSTGISGVDGSAGTPALQGGDTNTGISFGTDSVIASTGGTQRMGISANGEVLVNTTTPGGTGLTILPNSGPGTPAYINFNGPSPTSAVCLQFVYSGGVGDNEVGRISRSTTSTSYTSSSDYRLKENVTPVPDGITRLQQLKPSRFNFIIEPDKTVDGFLAHEAQAVVPECATGTKDEVDDEGHPVYQGIDQSKLVPLLTAALQEAIAKIEALETRITTLEAQP